MNTLKSLDQMRAKQIQKLKKMQLKIQKGLRGSSTEELKPYHPMLCSNCSIVHIRLTYIGCGHGLCETCMLGLKAGAGCGMCDQASKDDSPKTKEE